MDAAWGLRSLLGLAAILCLIPPLAAEPPSDRAPPTAEPRAAFPVDLQTALELTLSRNPDLLAVRENVPVSAAALKVAQQFPTSLNPTVSVDTRPWTFAKNTGAGSEPLEADTTISWMQPIELGGRTALRAQIASAALTQTQWNVLQAELSALVQTYRLHQTAAYRREKARVALQLAQFNQTLVATVERQMQANQATVANVSMAQVENQAAIQQLAASRQDYVAALTDLRAQMGIPEYADRIEASGPLRLPAALAPGSEEHLIDTALASRPEIHAAAAQVAGACAALRLARADRIPVPSVGPVYERDEAGTSFYGLMVTSPIPVLNAGGPLVRQREAEYCRDARALEQTQRRIRAQVKATLVKWTEVRELVAHTQATIPLIQAETARMERLYTAGQTDLLSLLQVRQRLIQAENAQLDAVWQSTQAYADLLTATGETPLIGSTTEPAQPPGGPR